MHGDSEGPPSIVRYLRPPSIQLHVIHYINQTNYSHLSRVGAHLKHSTPYSGKALRVFVCMWNYLMCNIIIINRLTLYSCVSAHNRH